MDYLSKKINYFSNFLKKDSYKLKDLKEELGEDMKLITSSIQNADLILMRSKEFMLYNRVTFILKEYEIIKKVNTLLINLKIKPDDLNVIIE